MGEYKGIDPLKEKKEAVMLPDYEIEEKRKKLREFIQPRELLMEEGTNKTLTDIEQTLEARGSRYGAFKDQAQVAQAIKKAFETGRNWNNLPADSREALETIATKISRILHGDPEYADSWHDIVGYAKLVDDRINGVIK